MTGLFFEKIASHQSNPPPPPPPPPILQVTNLFPHQSEMIVVNIVEVTEWTRIYLQAERQDEDETNIPNIQQLCCAGDMRSC